MRMSSCTLIFLIWVCLTIGSLIAEHGNKEPAYTWNAWKGVPKVMIIFGIPFIAGYYQRKYEE